MTSKKILVGLALSFISTVSFAQEEEGQVNPNSLLNIPKYEQLYKVKVWRVVDLREKQNKGFFAKGNEITNLILKAIASGELADIYANDSVVTKKSKDDFYKDMISQQGQSLNPWSPDLDFFQGDQVTFNGKNYEAVVDSKIKNPATLPNEWKEVRLARGKTPTGGAWDATKDYNAGDQVSFNGKNYQASAASKAKNPATLTDEWNATRAGAAVTFLPTEIFQMTIVEDVIFDKRRSRLYYDMLAMGFAAFDNNSGTYKTLGWFKYKDLEKLFRNHTKDAIWFNRYNTAENRNYADAFLLRLFHGTIDKVENPDNDRIADIYTANGRPYKEVVWAMEWEEMKMMEKEHNLWEY